jgi:hypothetical protein
LPFACDQAAQYRPKNLFAWSCQLWHVKFGFWLFMREYFTTGDLARDTGYTTERIRQLWNAGQIPAELINPGGKQLRFRKTQRLQDWRGEKAARARPRPIDNELWWKLERRKEDLKRMLDPYKSQLLMEKKQKVEKMCEKWNYRQEDLNHLLDPYQSSWNLEEMGALISPRRPARMNFDIWLTLLTIAELEAKARANGLRAGGPTSEAASDVYDLLCSRRAESDHVA